MELAGEEKRIQALFSELSFQDARITPDFGKLWREASLAPRRVPRFSTSLAAVAAALILAVTVLFVFLSGNESATQQNARNLAPQPIPSSSTPAASNPEIKFDRRRARSHSRRRQALARRQPSESALAQQAALLANWKSPTETFMTSPAPSVFSALPQLNESAKELESFLSTNESLKESNQ